MRKKVLFIVFVLFILFNFAFSYRMFLVKASSDLLVFLQDIFIIDDKDYSDYELIKDENVELKNEIEELKNTLDLNNTLVDKKIVNATIMSRNVTYFYDTFVNIPSILPKQLWVLFTFIFCSLKECWCTIIWQNKFKTWPQQVIRLYTSTWIYIFSRRD